CTFFASAAPSISTPRCGVCTALVPRGAPSPSPSTAAAWSARKIHRPGLANQHDLDLTGVLQLGLDAARDLLRHRRHTKVIDIVRHHDHAHLTPGLDRVDLVDALVTRCDALESLESLHVRLEGFASRTRPRSGNRV